MAGQYFSVMEEIHRIIQRGSAVIAIDGRCGSGKTYLAGQSYLALEVPGEETGNEWCGPVSDEEYGKLK